MIRIDSHTLDFYVDPIVKGKPYSFSRWGDGEWVSVVNKRRAPNRLRNCDGHSFFEEMGKDLQNVLLELRRPEYNYLVGMQAFGYRIWRKQIDKWLNYHKFHGRIWHDADVFHRASRKGQLGSLLGALGDANVVVVGPGHLRALNRVFGYNDFVEVPAKNCYLGLDKMIRDTRGAIQRAKKPVVVAISASMPAEILIHRLYPEVKDRAFLIDFGSLFDPYVGIRSRRYHRGLKL